MNYLPQIDLSHRNMEKKGRKQCYVNIINNFKNIINDFKQYSAFIKCSQKVQHSQINHIKIIFLIFFTKALPKKNTDTHILSPNGNPFTIQSTVTNINRK